MQLRILGPLEVSSDGDLLALGGPKQRMVLALLALRLGEVVAVDELIEAGWGDDLPANPTNALQYQVAQLRKVIEPDPARPRYLITTSPGYGLDSDTVTTDARRFAELLADARSAFELGEHDRAAASVDEALALWRGPALADFRYDEFVAGHADRLDAEWVAATELSVDIALATGRHEQVTAQLGQLTHEHPLREGLWSRRVLALYRSGRQSEALRVVQGARDALAEVGLGVGIELRELEQQVIDQDTSLSPEVLHIAPTPHNLPAPPNRLVGRDDDLEKVSQLLDAGRLVTLTGPGGAGKTRLAIAVGRAGLDRYPGGAWFVPLDGLDDAALLPAEIGRVTGMREDPEHSVIETLAEHLGSKTILLVLDNCEHVIEPVASFVNDLIATCDRLSVLATSQVTLEAAGEVVFEVTPLAIPGHTASIYDPITDIGAVALFLERARAAGVAVDDWDDEDLAAVANIVAALDGLPLAVELAAARTRSMSLDEIAKGLDDRFVILGSGPRTAPDRQRSLLGAVEWSLNLLDGRQRMLMAKLGVLSGGFDAGDAAAVTGEKVAAIRDDLASLVDRSLLSRRDDLAGTARFAMLESLRHYGVLDLESSQLESARNAHLDHFTEFVHAADAGLRGPDQISWLDRIDAAYDNIRSALAWSLDGGSLVTGIQLASHLGRYWDWRGLLKEGSSWARRLTDHDVDPTTGLASTLAWVAFIAWEFGDLGAARHASDRAIAVAAEMDHPAETAAALSTRVLISRSSGNLDAARSDSIAISHAAERAEDPWLIAWAASASATVALAADDLDAAETEARRSRDLFEDLGDRRAQGWGLIALAQVALIRGHLEDAEHHARAALHAATSTEDDRNALWTLEILAEAAQQRGDSERAARLWGAAHPLRESRGLAGSVSRLSEPSDLGDTLREELGSQFDSLLADVRADPAAVIGEELRAG